jgi:hypothetical protein
MIVIGYQQLIMDNLDYAPLHRYMLDVHVHGLYTRSQMLCTALPGPTQPRSDSM